MHEDDSWKDLTVWEPRNGVISRMRKAIGVEAMPAKQLTVDDPFPESFAEWALEEMGNGRKDKQVAD